MDVGHPIVQEERIYHAGGLAMCPTLVAFPPAFVVFGSRTP